MKVLVIEDSYDDFLLVTREMQRTGIIVDADLVSTEDDLENALASKSYDVILADFQLPSFDAFRSLEIYKSLNLDTPFLIVSGSIGEATAVAAMKAGVNDYILKDNLSLLCPAIERELKEVEILRRKTEMEQEVAKSQEFLRGTLDAIPSAICIIDPDRRIVYTNAAWRSHLHRNDGDHAVHQGQDYLPLVGRLLNLPASQLSSFNQQLTLLFQGEGEDVREDFYTGQNDGDPRWFQVRANRFQSGGSINVVLIVEDITEARSKDDALLKSQKELLTSEVKFRSLFERANDAFMLADDSGNIVEMNPAAREMLGAHNIETPVSMGTFALSEDWVEEWGRFLEQGNRQGEITLRRYDNGEFIDVDFSSIANVIPGMHLSINRDVTERKRAQKELEVNRHFVESLTETSPVILFVYDVESDSNVYSNREFLTALGYSDEALRNGLGIVRELVHEEDIPLLIESYELLAASPDGTVIDTEFRIRAASGEWRWLSCRSLVFTRKPDGMIATILGAAEDISQRKVVEQALKESEVKFRRLFESDMLGVVFFDKNLRITDANGHFMRMTNYSHADIRSTNLHWANLTPPEFLPADEEALESIREGEACEPYEKELIRKDGTRIAVLSGAAPLPGEDLFGVCFVLDITARKQIEAELESSLRLLQTTIDSSHDGILVIDDNDHIEFYNNRFAEMWNLGDEVLQSGDDRKIINACYDQVIEREKYIAGCGEKEQTELHGTFELKNGRIFERYIHWISSDQTVKRIYTLRDITERHQYDQQIRSLNMQLEQRVTERTAQLEAANRELEDQINARFLAEKAVTRRNRELSAINEVSTVLTNTTDINQLLTDLTRLISGRLDAPAGIIALKDEAASTLQVVVTWGIPTNAERSLGRLIDNCPLSNEVLESQHVTITSDMSLVNFEEMGMNRVNSIWNSLISAPIVAQQECIGLLHVFGRDIQSFSAREADLFETIGQQLGVAIQNIRLIQRLQSSNERLQGLSRKIVDVQEAERRHIAKELHDEIGQTLTGLHFALEMTRRQPSESGLEHLIRAQKLVSELMQDVRALSLELRPAMLDDLGLLPALVWYIDRYSEQTQIKVNLQHSGLAGRLSAEVETAVYRIVQEALTNVARHAKVKSVTVQLWQDGKDLCVQIEDNGPGFDVNAALSSGKTTGVTGMHERAALLGGKLTINSRRGQTVLSARFPVSNQAPELTVSET